MPGAAGRAARIPTAAGAWAAALAAALAGAAGLGLEVLLIGFAGLSIGQGRAGALGIALYVAGWALGARLSTRVRRPRVGLLVAGAASCAAALAAPWALLAAGRGGTAEAAALALAAACLLAVAVPQGALLPLVVRGFGDGSRLGLAPWIAANLLGCAVGAELFGDRLPAAFGRVLSAAAAGGTALAAGLLGAALLVARPAASPVSSAAPGIAGPAGALDARVAGALLALLVAVGASAEVAALRLGVLWFGGMQPALGAVLVASMIALTVGAALGPVLAPRGLGGVALLLFACAIAPTAAFAAPWTAGALGRGAGDLPRALALVGPMLLPFGAAVPLLHRELARRDETSLGRLLGWEALGALVGVPLLHTALLPRVGLGGSLGAGAALVALALVAVPGLRRGARVAWTLAAAGAAALACALPPPALSAPPLANPALQRVAFAEDEHFAVTVVDDGVLGERTLLTDGFRAAATGPDYRYMRALGHLPLLLHAAPRRVGVLAFGTGTTAGAVSLHPEVEALEVLELSSSVIEFAPHFTAVNRGVLERRGVRVTLGDGRRTLARRAAAYDVLTMEPLLPSSPFAVYLYTPEFYQRARGALRPGGLLCQWVPPHALEPVVLEAVLDGFARAFPWSGAWLFGTQLLLVGSDAPPALDPSRFAVGGELGAELEALGLDSPAALAARWIFSGDEVVPAERRLSDADPWIVYRPMPAGAAALAMCPENLAALRRLESDPPAAWTAGFGAAERARADAVEALRRAREAFALGVAERAGASFAGRDLERELGAPLDEARRLAPTDGGLRAFEAELELHEARRAGLVTLAAGAGPASGRAALPELLTAVESRPERADGHLYVAVALERMGELSAAAKALERALELCPRLLETRAGEQARALGFPATDALAAVGKATPGPP